MAFGLLGIAFVVAAYEPGGKAERAGCRDEEHGEVSTGAPARIERAGSAPRESPPSWFDLPFVVQPVVQGGEEFERGSARALRDRLGERRNARCNRSAPVEREGRSLVPVPEREPERLIERRNVVVRVRAQGLDFTRQRDLEAARLTREPNLAHRVALRVEVAAHTGRTWLDDERMGDEALCGIGARRQPNRLRFDEDFVGVVVPRRVFDAVAHTVQFFGSISMKRIVGSRLLSPESSIPTNSTR